MTAEAAALPTGRGGVRLALERLRRNPAAWGSAIVLAAILIACFPLASVWVHVACGHGPNDQNIQGYVTDGGHRVPVVALDGTPIGPGWRACYLLGADSNGRDLMVRLLYGGRVSLEVGIGSAVVCVGVALVLALLAGYAGGVTDAAISRSLDLIWAFPVYLLAISLATVLLTKPDGLQWGPIHVVSSSLWVPTVIIAVVYVPYVFRPVRGQVLSIREKEYVEAATAAGASNRRLMFSEILPNVLTTVIVMLPLMIATTVLTEAALSFLGIGVQEPQASWGTIIDDGQALLYTRPLVAIVPGIMIVLVVLSLNVFGDGLRDALDPRAKVK